MAVSSPRLDHGATPLFRFCLLLRAQALVCLYPIRPSCFFDSRGDNRTAVNLRDDLVPVHLGRVPYGWLTHLVFLSVAPFDALSSVPEGVDLRSLLLLPYYPALFDPTLSMAIGSKTGLSLFS